MRLCDIEAIADIADDDGVPFAVDSTFASPYCQAPLELGADVVVHSTTKYLNGHSDSTGGAVITNDDRIAERLGFVQQTGLGNVLTPFDCYLVSRGVKTLREIKEKASPFRAGMNPTLPFTNHVRWQGRIFYANPY